MLFYKFSLDLILNKTVLNLFLNKNQQSLELKRDSVYRVEGKTNLNDQLLSEQINTKIGSLIGDLQSGQITACLNAISKLKDIAEADPKLIPGIVEALLETAKKKEYAVDVREYCIANLKALIPYMNKVQLSSVTTGILVILGEICIQPQILQETLSNLLCSDPENLIPILIDKIDCSTSIEGDRVDEVPLCEAILKVFIHFFSQAQALTLDQELKRGVLDCFLCVLLHEKALVISNNQKQLISSDLIEEALKKLSCLFREDEFINLFIYVIKAIDNDVEQSELRLSFSLAKMVLDMLMKNQGELEIKKLIGCLYTLQAPGCVISILEQLVDNRKILADDVQDLSLALIHIIKNTDNENLLNISMKVLGKISSNLELDRKKIIIELLKDYLLSPAFKESLYSSVIWALNDIAISIGRKDLETIDDILVLLEFTRSRSHFRIRADILEIVWKISQSCNDQQCIRIFGIFLASLGDNDANVRFAAAEIIRRVFQKHGINNNLEIKRMVDLTIMWSLNNPPNTGIENWEEAKKAIKRLRKMLFPSEEGNKMGL